MNLNNGNNLINLNKLRKVTDWFKDICNKHLPKFVIFDIKELCHQKPAKKVSTFGKAHTLLSDDDKTIIQLARKSVLFRDQQAWSKRNIRLFDVITEAYDEAEICELVWNYLL